eukprot:GEMP01028062.1.p1 GENE.GEMP01028062.1~~GEMP01028062.1.p1  ORF type:complete len:441 (+),score=71.54 GEMP01028062.1:366-1688(+)
MARGRKSAWAAPSKDATDGRHISQSKAKANRIHWADRNGFRCFISVTILVNATMVGVEVDYGPHSRKKQIESGVFDAFNQIFCTIYFLEFVVRCNEHRLKYFMNPWNIFDFSLVLLAVTQNWILSIAQLDMGLLKDLTALRLFHMARIARVLRIFYVFKDLWFVLQGFIRSIVVLCWVTLTLVLLFGVMVPVCRMLILPGDDPHEMFSSMPSTALSLFQLMTLDNWAHRVVRPIMENGNVFATLLFLMWIMFTNHGILNVILGLIVLGQKDIADDVHAAVAKEIRSEKVKGVSALKRFFEASDTNKDGTLEFRELKLAMNNTVLNNLFLQIGLPIREPEALFLFLNQGKGFDTPLTFAAFAQGCRRLLTTSKQEDMLRLSNSISTAQLNCLKQSARCEALALEIYDIEVLFDRLLEPTREFALTTIDPLITYRREIYFGE